MSLFDLPEEVLEYALRLVLVDPLSLPTGSAQDSPSAQSAFLPILLVNRALNRIGTPVLYHSVHLTKAATAAILACTLVENPERYAPHVRSLSVDAIYASVPVILRALSPCNLAHLELMLKLSPYKVELSKLGETYIRHPAPESGPPGESLRLRVARDLAQAFSVLAPGPRTFVLNRPAMTFGTKCDEIVIGGLARALPSWTALHRVEIPFRLSDPRQGPDPGHADDIEGERALPLGLARVPNLKSVCTLVPSVWSPALQLVASNMSLERLELTTSRLSAGTQRVIEPVPGRVTEEYFQLFPPSAAQMQAAPQRSNSPGPSTLTSAGRDTSPSSSSLSSSSSPSASTLTTLEERLRGPVEIVSRFGLFHDKTRQSLRIKQRVLTRAQVLQDREGGQSGGQSAWLIEARKDPRLLELMLAGASDGKVFSTDPFP
ncbi:hypothetical protein K488DRAFT_82514 [Vararia minispora EC-137]|uniref:Uncharacterized protein n=1 Tax=Vararia minispora EC-137 TaxID=1314806 RepID=A0ACB8QWL2_9AGAM|nr:hypothetical protein K488DRAFT_82514 [Vararia minispora EC-137]